MKSKRRVRRGITVCLLVICILLIFLRSASTKRLLTNAVEIADTTDWIEPEIDGGRRNYFWNSSTTFVSFHQSHPVNMQPSYATSATETDTITHSSRQAPTLLPFSKLYGPQVSPDGKWLFGNNASMTQIQLHTMQGARSFSQPNLWAGENPVWFPDSKHWVTMRPSMPGPAMYIYGLGASPPQTLPFTNLPYGYTLLGFLKDGTLLSHAYYDGNQPRSDKMQFYAYQIGSQLALARSYRLTVPDVKDAQEISVLLSPSGEKLLWHIYKPSRNTANFVLSRILRKWTPNLLLGGQSRLYVSDVNGSNMQFLGSLDRDVQPGLQSRFVWLPDGKRVSFVYANKLYTVDTAGL